MSELTKCQSCGWTGPETDLATRFPNIPDLGERVAPGETTPAGECPKCGALAHVVDLDFKAQQVGLKKPSGRIPDELYETLTVLMFSTIHLSRSAIDYVESADCPLPVAKWEYGFFVYADPDTIHDGSVPPSLANILKRARALGVEWARFDTDGPTYLAEFPDYQEIWP